MRSAPGIQGKTIGAEAMDAALRVGPCSATVCVRWFNDVQCAALDGDVESMQVAFVCFCRLCVHLRCLRAVCHLALQVQCRNVAGRAFIHNITQPNCGDLAFGLHKCRIPIIPIIRSAPSQFPIVDPIWPKKLV